MERARCVLLLMVTMLLTETVLACCKIECKEEGEGNCNSDKVCKNGLKCGNMDSNFCNKVEKACCYTPVPKLIRNTWKSLERVSSIRLFSSKRYTKGSKDMGDIWDMGETISCSVNDDLTVNVGVPDGFNGALPFKILTHGFNDNVQGDKVNFVKAWIEMAAGDINVILFDWSDMATMAQASGKEDSSYDAAAKNAIDVGEYLGQCLSALKNTKRLSASNLHLVGHSLGAHLMGKAGRTFKGLTSESIGRITGLDPAGPRFINGPVMNAIQELNENRINSESASFVDIIHTDGSLSPAALASDPHCGDLNPLGHADFYPQGGSNQPGCKSNYLGMMCNHGRAVKYFLHSIWEPELFPSKECADVNKCKNKNVVSDGTQAYMGESSKIVDGISKLYYIDIQGDNWTYADHN